MVRGPQKGREGQGYIYSKERGERRRPACLTYLCSLLQMLSRIKPAVGGGSLPGDKRKKKGKRIPQLEELLILRDFTGGIALLEVPGIRLGDWTDETRGRSCVGRGGVDGPARVGSWTCFLEPMR